MAFIYNTRYFLNNIKPFSLENDTVQSIITGAMFLMNITYLII